MKAISTGEYPTRGKKATYSDLDFYKMMKVFEIRSRPWVHSLDKILMGKM
jgi:hypothetical protein